MQKTKCDMSSKNTCILITGPRSASGSVPHETLRALARSTSLSSLVSIRQVEANLSVLSNEN